ncbi:MAG: type I-B CRISPR-associated protein Cas7/Csh2 [Candidatus Atabeyarchaeum deiterrae]
MSRTISKVEKEKGKTEKGDTKAVSDIVANRSELLFLYDVTDSNPNGDPADENKPRIDEETRKNIVTDVRLKRTIRDHLLKFKGKEIFVREIKDDQGNIQDAKMRAKDFKNSPGKIVEECIDVRLFGGVIPLGTLKGDMKKESNQNEESDEIEEIAEKEEGSIKYTGPVQFKMGRSLNKVELKYVKGTGAFASKPRKEQKTFREEWVLPYSLICFYGIINENQAKVTSLTENDVALLLDGMWNGTKNLISRSKVGQMPRLLLKVNYKDKNYHVGDLDALIEHKSDVPDEQLRGISDLTIDVTGLVNTLRQHSEKISSIGYKVDERVKTSIDGKEQELAEFLRNSGLRCEKLEL